MKQTIELTDDQKTAYDEIIDWLQNSDDTYKTLAGYAGTGKTVLMDFITDYCFVEDLEVIVTATTNKAVKVLKQAVEAEKFSTIHKLLNIKPRRKGTKEWFEPVYASDKMNIRTFDLVIIDESSMISRKLLGYIDKALEDEAVIYGARDTKVLFVGDPAQLQPVNESISPCFNFNPSKLNKIVRHGDVIANVSKKFRSTKEYIPFEEAIQEPQIQWVTVDDLKGFFKDFRKEPDEYRLLSWTNRSVKNWNYKLRVFDYGFIPKEEFKEGDIIFANEACKDFGDAIIMNNSEEGEIERISMSADEHGIEYYELKVKKESGGHALLNVIKKEFKEKNNSILKDLASAKKWSEFWARKDYYHDVTHCYSMTVHKSQGSSFNNIILNINDLDFNKNIEERNQLVYVGITRAVDKVYLLR